MLYTLFLWQDLNKSLTHETSRSLDFVGLIGSLDTMTILKKVCDSLNMKVNQYYHVYIQANTTTL